MIDSLQELPVGLGALPKLEIPADNPQNREKVELGRKLFFSKELSGDKSMSCATCHNPEHGFSDGKPRAVGFRGKTLLRHTPSLLNAAYNSNQFWDGRAPSLEQQATGPITSAAEMSMPENGLVTARPTVPAKTGLAGNPQSVFTSTKPHASRGRPSVSDRNRLPGGWPSIRDEASRHS